MHLGFKMGINSPHKVGAIKLDDPLLTVCLYVCFFFLGTHSFLASGSLYKVDPDRIIAKKIVLSGFPYKINKRSAVIRYMFFNRGKCCLMRKQ